jgi:hypothetical protein
MCNFQFDKVYLCVFVNRGHNFSISDRGEDSNESKMVGAKDECDNDSDRNDNLTYV